MRILILGGGWYGCFIGLVLEILGIEYLILEKNDDIFEASSFKNQNRLHLGYHYPRSKGTRDECIVGYKYFNDMFGFLLAGITNNYYLIEKGSLIGFEEYKKIYNNDNVVQAPVFVNLEKGLVSGIIKCDEKVIDHTKARMFFRSMLAGKYIGNYDQTKLKTLPKILYDGKEYDYMINCTYGHALYGIEKINIEYELCLSLVYDSPLKNNTNFAVTMMDGKYFSLYPYMNSMKSQYTLTDVEFTPLYKSKNIKELYEFEKNITAKSIEPVKSVMENRARKYIRNFNELFRYNSYFVSYKSKFANKEDDRSLKYFRSGKIISFIGGKITGIFAAVDVLFREIPELARMNAVYNKHNEETKNVVKSCLGIFKRQITEREVDFHSANKVHGSLCKFVYEIVMCPEFRHRFVLPLRKMAILFFGYTRDLARNYGHHQAVLKLGADVFIHTYKTPGKKSMRRFTGNKWIDETDFQKFIDVDFICKNYKPKKLRVEDNNLNNFSINDGNIIPLYVFQAHDDATRYINSQLYTKYQVCKLKEEYEKEMGFKYDIVLLMRFDFGVSQIKMDFIKGLDMTNIYFPGKNSKHTHPGGGGGCRGCDKGIYHVGLTHKNDMCDLWCLSNSTNIDLVGSLFLHAKNIIYSTRLGTFDYIKKTGIKYSLEKNFLYIYNNIEDEKVVCYYPERLLREFLKQNVCLTCEHISGQIIDY